MGADRIQLQGLQGQGAVDFPKVMAELRAAGYAGPLISEVPASLAPLAETAATIRKIIAM